MISGARAPRAAAAALATSRTKNNRFPAACAAAVVGILKGYDQLLNLVLDEATEFLRGG